MNTVKCLSLLVVLLGSWTAVAGDSCPTTLAKPKRVAIVAAVSSGGAIAPRFKTKGVESVHVMPETGLPAGYRVRESDFTALIPYSPNIQEMISALKAQGVTAVIAGSEMGVELADALSEAMGFRTNGTRLSTARRNKFIMQETVKKHKTALYPHGIPGIRERLVKTVAEFKAWHREENEGRYPVVIKPYQSAGTDGLYICENEVQVDKALQSLLGKMSFLGTPNDALLAQEYLNLGTRIEDGRRIVIPGVEYVVDAISVDGKVLVTDVWRYHKTLIRRPEGGLSNIYDYDELLDFNDPLVKQLIAYAEGVLEALQINNGPSHMEIMITDRGPVLVEVGARLIGGGSHIAVEAGTGVSPIDVLYEAYVDPQAFHSRQRQSEPIRRKKFTWVPQFIAHKSGKIKALPRLEEIRKLPSTVRLDSAVKVGDDLKKTIDLLTSPGQVIFSHEVEAQVKADLGILRQAEYEDFFVLE